MNSRTHQAEPWPSLTLADAQKDGIAVGLSIAVKALMEGDGITLEAACQRLSITSEDELKIRKLLS